MDKDDKVWVFWDPARPLVASEDVPWLLDWILGSTGSVQAQQFAAELVRRLLNFDDSDNVSAVLVACDASDVLRSSLAGIVDPIALDSPLATQLRAAHQERFRWEREHEESMANRSKMIDPPPTERVSQSLDRCENVDIGEFWRLVTNLSLAPNGRSVEEFHPDLTVLPGWKDADSATRIRIVNAAERYVREGEPEPDRWLGTNIWFRPAFAGYKALCLAIESDPDFALSLTPADWSKWAPVIVAYPLVHDARNDAIHSRLICAAYRHAPREVIRAVRICIERDIAKNGMVFGLDQLKPCWDEPLSQMVFEIARRPETTLQAFRELLATALSRQLPEAIAYAATSVTGDLGEEADRRSTAAALLLVYTPGSSWDQVWTAIQGDEDFGRQVIATLAGLGFGPLLRIVPEMDLATLYLKVVNWHPYTKSTIEEDDDGGAHFGPDNRETRLRDALLNALKERGTFEAGVAIQHIMQALPEVEWLKYSLYEARTKARATTWEPPDPQHVFALGDELKGRLVRSGPELRTTVVSSLLRLERKLQEETPAAIDLWNGPDRHGHYTPKDEEALSNYVKRHLTEDLPRRGIVVNREVEIRRGEGGAPGEKTDIHVNAISRDAGGKITDVVTVIVEVKGCWNRELGTAMETQLVQRYLRDNAYKDGVYLVGWFNCPQWDPGDYRRARAPGYSLAEASQRFHAQAEALSIGSVRVSAIVLNCALR